MTFLDKNNIIPSISNLEKPILELGCGNNKKVKDSIGIDILDYDNVDIVGDIYEVLKSIPDQSIFSVHSFHFFEHVSDVPLLLTEISRVLAVNGVLEVVVPHFSNPHFYSDYTHKNFYGLYTFSYLAVDNIFQRKTPTYQRQLFFEILSVRLVFKSQRPFIFRYGFKKLFLENLFNSSIWMKEFYEENLCYIFPCYELVFTMKKNSQS